MSVLSVSVWWFTLENNYRLALAAVLVGCLLTWFIYFQVCAFNNDHRPSSSCDGPSRIQTRTQRERPVQVHSPNQCAIILFVWHFGVNCWPQKLIPTEWVNWKVLWLEPFYSIYAFLSPCSTLNLKSMNKGHSCEIWFNLLYSNWW